MTKLRTDQVTGQEVIVVPGRASRPVTAIDRIAAEPSSNQAGDRSCPFCTGNETETPPEVFRIGEGKPDTPGWKVRVVPNLYPIVDDATGVTGAHEVVVLSPAHDTDFGGLTDAAAGAVLFTARERAKFHDQAGRAHTQIFINHGQLAGASIAHPHAQIVTLDIIAPQVMAEVARYKAKKNVIGEDATDAANHGGSITTKGQMRAWCPTGSISSYLVRIAINGSENDVAELRFENTSDELIQDSAIILRDVLAALAKSIDAPNYNVVLHNPPARDPESSFMWWIEVIPRISVLGGFELGSGIFVNTVDPAVAAAILRENL